MLQMVNKIQYCILSFLLLCSCDKIEMKGLIMPTSDVVNKRFEQSFAIHQGKPVASIQANSTYSIHVCTDTHISDDNSHFRTFVTQLRNDGSAIFGAVVGDCIDQRGSMPLYQEALAYDAEEHRTDVPVFSAIGNHDLYFSSWDDFRELIGPSVYWFEVICDEEKDLYIVLDSASGTHGGKQMRWLRDFLTGNRKNYRHCIVLTHTNIFYTDNTQASSGNLPMEETMEILHLFGENNVTLCLQGHDHYREVLTFGGVRYITLGSISNKVERPEFLCIKISADGLKYDWRYPEKSN